VNATQTRHIGKKSSNINVYWRTEDPTPRRLEEAQRRGDVVKSMEVNTWFTIAGGTLAIMVFAAPMASSL
jgi:flagellar biosynthetic protein FlhB